MHPLSPPDRRARLDRIDRSLTGLLERIAAGNEPALLELYSLAGRAVHALALRLLRDHHMAEEATADVFLQVWRQAGRFDARRGDPRAWLMTLARTRAIDRLRAASAGRIGAADSQAAVERVPAANGSASSRDLREVVRGGLAALPSLQRTAIELAYYDGLTQTEIATRLCEPLGTIKTRMRLGLKKLREHLSTKDLHHGR